MITRRVYIILLILWGTNFLQSCQKEQLVHVKIIDVMISGAKLIEKGDTLTLDNYACTGDLKSDIVFAISYQRKYLDYVTSQVPEDQDDYANPDKWIVDEIVEDSYLLSFDTDFVFDGDTLYANMNLFDSETIVAEMDLYRCSHGFCGTSADLMINFSDLFVASSIFSDSKFAVTFSSETTYGLTVIDSTYVAVR